ncbi:hypothetical protein [Kingella sp. (in: b-proteobacteria)]|uniref:hypothetical protein n=1 Tax=Kingella sp. (in: b-proteobacteria) TaxID=2020713 RepID=UPI0026DBB18D|nr:hypothetical protein [Kingella sp. (in: b-proteobacteria)]MDO4658240.1 hypothetical protein [Kingella sp. (in: b-proteobacteria)]
MLTTQSGRFGLARRKRGYGGATPCEREKNGSLIFRLPCWAFVVLDGVSGCFEHFQAAD